MSVSIDATSKLTFLAGIWRPAGAWYLALCLAGLAIGLWPDCIYPASLRLGPVPAPLPALATLAVGQSAFCLLVYPLILLCRVPWPGCVGHADDSDGTYRSLRRSRLVHLASVLGLRSSVFGRFDGTYRSLPLAASSNVALAYEALALVLVAAPFYLASAWLSDAILRDVLRCVLYLLGLFVLSAALGDLLRRDSTRTAGLIAMLTILLGLPSLYYVCLEFAPSASCEWLRSLSPAMMAWDAAQARGGSLTPQPLWAWIVWPALGVAVKVVCRRA